MRLVNVIPFPRVAPPIVLRLLSRVKVAGPDLELDCWEWTGALTSCGYGVLRLEGSLVYVHRVSYRVFRGPVPRHRLVLHQCDNRRCVNPAHLELGTQSRNIAETWNRGARRRAREVLLG